jgi:transcriptional regulator with XRE-family HTH domain
MSDLRLANTLPYSKPISDLTRRQGAFLRALRTARNVSMGDVARALGTSVARISAVERGSQVYAHAELQTLAIKLWYPAHTLIDLMDSFEKHEWEVLEIAQGMALIRCPMCNAKLEIPVNALGLVEENG